MTEILATLVFVFVLDRGTKTLVFGRAGSCVEARGVAHGVLRPRRNARPALWPRGSAASWVLAFAWALVATLWLVRLDPYAGVATRIGLGAMLGGALGNLYDRLRHGAVQDFLYLGRGGVFNLADVALVGGLSSVVLAHLVAMS